MPTVTMIEFARNNPMTAPLAAPTATPSASGVRIDSRVRGASIGCICTDTTAASVRMAPTDRSKLPVIRTTTTPIATIPTIDTWRRTFRRLVEVRKLEEVVARKAITAKSTIQTQSRRIRVETRAKRLRLVAPRVRTGSAVRLESDDTATHQFLVSLI